MHLLNTAARSPEEHTKLHGARRPACRGVTATTRNQRRLAKRICSVAWRPPLLTTPALPALPTHPHPPSLPTIRHTLATRAWHARRGHHVACVHDTHAVAWPFGSKRPPHLLESIKSINGSRVSSSTLLPGITTAPPPRLCCCHQPSAKAQQRHSWAWDRMQRCARHSNACQPPCVAAHQRVRQAHPVASSAATHATPPPAPAAAPSPCPCSVPVCS
jgi:hypothetical protein